MYSKGFSVPSQYRANVGIHMVRVHQVVHSMEKMKYQKPLLIVLVPTVPDFTSTITGLGNP